jgi:hypothetical protein
MAFFLAGDEQETERDPSTFGAIRPSLHSNYAFAAIHANIPRLHDLVLAVNRLLDDLLGTGKKRARHRQAKRLCGSQVDHHLEPGRRLDRQLVGSCALEDPVNVSGGTPVQIGQAYAV